MGRILPRLSGGFILRLFLGSVSVYLLFLLSMSLMNFNSHALIPLQQIRRMLLTVPEQTPGVRSKPVVDKIDPVRPAVHTNSSISSHEKRLFNVTPIKSTGSDDLNFPLHLDFPELVRRILDNQSVSVEPINQPNFEILVSNPEKCQPLSLEFKTQPDLLILVKSAPSHFELRDAIRSGWGNVSCWGGRQIVQLFLLGTVPESDSEVAMSLNKEMTLYNDIIQQDFVDHYYNNTYKMLFGLQWTLRYCANVPLIMFVDDDFFVYPRNVVAYMEGLSEGVRDRLISGYVWPRSFPIRTNRTNSRKWFVDKKEYPDRYYPPYVAAGNFFISMQMARELFTAAQYTRYLRFDDVFLGILLKKLVRTPIHLKQIYAYFPVNQSSPQLRDMISSHQFKDAVAQKKMWDKLGCSQFCI